MPSKTIVEDWLKKADEDFGFATINLKDPENPFHAQICFHFQQAAEKYLKTYIVAHNLEFRKIHDLPQLLQICSAHKSSFSDLSEECDFLTDFYVDARYPVHWPSEVTREEAEKSREYACKIKDFVKSIIKNIDRV